MPGWLATTLLVASRVAALVVVVPGLSSRVVPWRIRFMLIVLLTVPVLCVVSPCVDGTMDPAQFFTLLIREVSVGISLALVPAVLLFGLQLATESLLGMTGLPGGSPEGELPSQGVSRFFFLVALTVFFASSGHRIVFQSLLDSFSWMPVGSVRSLATTKEILVDLFSQSFQLGVRAVAPLAGSLAVGLLVLAAINRVIPQLGYFAVGMSVQNTVLFASMVIFLGGIGLFLEAGFESTIDSWQSNWLAATSNAP